MPEQEVISAVSSYHLQRFTQRWRLQSPSLFLFSSASPWLMLDQRSQSAEPVIIEAAEGAEPHPPQPWGSINISQIRLQKNTVFIRDLCKLWRRVSPSILCGESFLSFVCIWCLTEVCLLQAEEGYRPSNKQSQLIRVCCFQMWEWNHTNWTEAVFWFHREGWRAS